MMFVLVVNNVTLFSTKELKKVVPAKIIELIHGKNDLIQIKIENTTVYTTNRTIDANLNLTNGESIFFLKRYGESYKPLTPFSTVRFSDGKAAPIWRQNKNGWIPKLEKEVIIREIKKNIEQLN